jgi:hypothetical protein
MSTHIQPPGEHAEEGSARGPGRRVSTGHETSDINIRGVLGFGVGLLIAGVAIHVLVLLLFTVLSSSESRRGAQPQFPLAAGQENRLPPEPRLQTNPRQDLRDLRSQEETILHNYGWVDRNAGIVRIPIDRAMRLTVERELAALPGKGEGGKGEGGKGEGGKGEGRR